MLARHPSLPSNQPLKRANHTDGLNPLSISLSRLSVSKPDNVIGFGFSNVVPEGPEDPRQPCSRVRLQRLQFSLPGVRDRPALHEAGPGSILTRVIQSRSEPDSVSAREP